jgi:DNA ligase-1
MKFSELANYFSQLEATTKRLELIDILSSLFKKVKTAEDAHQVTYLLQGRVAAFYEPIEFGMGERLLERAIANVYDLEIDKVKVLNGKKGDVALVAESEAERKNCLGSGLKIKDVFLSLVEITQKSGDGSVEGKVEILAELLSKADPLEAKYIMRIVSGRLRLGVGDPTVLEALSLARLGDRKYRKELERAYNEVSDLGVIAETLWGETKDEREKIKDSSENVDSLLKMIGKLRITVGRPVRSELCERLSSPEKTIEKMGTVVSQFKFDGFRTQMHFDRKKKICRLFSRNLEETTPAFPELIQGLMDQIDADSVILDSEALAYHPDSEEFFPFQETTKRRRKHGIEEMAEALPLRAFVFDILYKNGEALVDLSLNERLKILKETIKKNVNPEKADTLMVAECRTISTGEELGLMLNEALTTGLEGLVVKKEDSPYEAGARNFNWVKLKHDASEHLKDTVDCVVLGYIFGRGKRTAFGVGALLVGVYDKERDVFVSISKIGTGLSDAEWVEVRKRCDDLVSKEKPARIESAIVPSVWVEPEVVIEVLADEITRSPLHTAGKTESEPGYALRFPRLITFRDHDKRPEDATSVEEIKELFKLQGKK